MAYIYQITNDINQKIYVGKTEFSIEKRFKEHCSDALKEYNEKRPLYAAMRKYGIEHFHIELIEETDNPEEREIYWIEQKRSFKYGYNATIGGDGRKYLDYDLVIATYNELQNLCRVSEKLNISTGYISKILKENNIEIISSGEHAINRLNYIINQYSKDGEFIQSFPSCTAAAKYLGKISKENRHPSNHIAEVCKGKRKTAYGYIWKYANK